MRPSKLYLILFSHLIEMTQANGLYLSGCSFSCLHGPLHVPAPLGSRLRASKVDSVNWLANDPSKQMENVRWQVIRRQWSFLKQFIGFDGALNLVPPESLQTRAGEHSATSSPCKTTYQPLYTNTRSEKENPRGKSASVQNNTSPILVLG